jgi:hypothetical protein
LHRLYREGRSERAIALELQQRGYQVSRSTVNRQLTEYRNNTETTRGVGKGKGNSLSDRTKRWVKRQVMVHHTQSHRETIARLGDMGMDVSRTSIWRVLHSDPYLWARRPKKGMFLTRQHKADRVSWAKAQQQAKIDWTRVLFSDEKLWYLDGPAVRPKIWQHKLRPPVRVETKGLRNAAVAVWGAFSLGRVPDLCFISKHYKSEEYCKTLGSCLVPNVSVKRYTLYHDRLPVHKSVQTEQWLRDHHVRSVLFPAKGADLNPIENLWAIVSHKVYGATGTYTKEKCLETAITAAWAEVQQNTELRRKLVGSMPERLAQVVARKGDWISY